MISETLSLQRQSVNGTLTKLFATSGDLIILDISSQWINFRGTNFVATFHFYATTDIFRCDYYLLTVFFKQTSYPCIQLVLQRTGPGTIPGTSAHAHSVRRGSSSVHAQWRRSPTGYRTVASSPLCYSHSLT